MDEVATKSAPDIVDYKYSYDVPPKLKISSVEEKISNLRAKIAPYRFRLAARNIARELGLHGGETILELGSGLGLLGKAIQEEAGGDLKYYGLELAFNPAKKSKGNLIKPVQADVLNLPFKNNSFDAIVSTDVLEHVPNANEVVAEIRRVLKTGGNAFIVIADQSEPRFKNVIDHIERTKEGSDVSFWEDLFKKHGFCVLEGESEKYRRRDFRRVFNLPFLIKLKDRPGFACAFNPINRPGTYILKRNDSL